MSICTCHDVLIVKNLNRWFKEKWVDVSRKDKDGKHPPCGRSKAKKGSKGYPKCRPSVKVSSKTPKTSGSMSEGEKRAATKRKRSKKQGVGGKPTIVKEDNLLKEDIFSSKNMPYDHTKIDYHLLSHDELAYLSRLDSTPPTIHDIKVNEEIARRKEEFKETEANLNQYHKETGNHPESDFIDRDVPIRNLGRYSKDNDVQIMMPMTFTHNFEAGDDDWQAKNASEPMDIAWRLLKDAVSPEAKRHKLEYDKKYESSPERVKYREELNRERRKRGIYGHGGPDMSHTKDHTLVAESPHANRARHFKERGTLKG